MQNEGTPEETKVVRQFTPPRYKREEWNPGGMGESTRQRIETRLLCETGIGTGDETRDLDLLGLRSTC